MLQPPAQYQQPNPKHAITFFIVSIVILLLPVFWNPLRNERVGGPIGEALTASPIPPASPVVSSPSPAAQAAETAPVSLGEAVLSVETPAPPATEPTAAFGDRPYGYGHEDPTVAFSRELRRGIISLLLTVLVIGVSLRMLKNRLPGLAGVGAPKPGKLVNILAREALGPTQSIAVVQVGSKILLVGLSDHGMNTLCELTEADLAAAQPAEPASAEEPPQPRTAQSLYGDVLRHYLSIVPGLGANKK